MEPVVDYNREPLLVYPDLVWYGMVDKSYVVEVHRLDQALAEKLQIQQESYDPAYQGVLCIFEQNGDKQLLYFDKVILAYGAPFGPDTGDVAMWQEKVVNFIDNILPTASES